MNLKDLVLAGAFNPGKWICAQPKCQKEVKFIRVIPIYSKNDINVRKIVFKGKCEKHKDDIDLTFEELVKMVNK